MDAQLAYEKGGAVDVEAAVGAVIFEAFGVMKTPLTSLKTMDETGVTSKPVSQIMDVGEVLIAAVMGACSGSGFGEAWISACSGSGFGEAAVVGFHCSST